MREPSACATSPAACCRCFCPHHLKCSLPVTGLPSRFHSLYGRPYHALRVSIHGRIQVTALLLPDSTQKECLSDKPAGNTPVTPPVAKQPGVTG